MRRAVFAAVCASFIFVVYVAIWGDPASVTLVGGYIVASLSSWALSRIAPDRAGRIKWAWVVLSLVVMGSILSGPLNVLHLG